MVAASSYLDISEGVGVEVVGKGVADPPVLVGEEGQVKQIPAPGLKEGLACTVVELQHLQNKGNGTTELSNKGRLVCCRLLIA